jgi:predicted metalloprotease with PDZ domain
MKTFLSALLALAFISKGTLSAQEKGALGVTMSDNKPGGVLVTSVLAGSPAAKIGLQAGDRILSINGQQTDNYRDVERVTASHKPGDKVELMVVRGAWRTKLTAILGPKGAVFTAAPKTVAPPRPIPTAEDPHYAPPGWYGLDFSDPNAEGAYGAGGY